MSDPFEKLREKSYNLQQSSAWVIKAATALGAVNDGVRFWVLPDTSILNVQA